MWWVAAIAVTTSSPTWAGRAALVAAELGGGLPGAAPAVPVDPAALPAEVLTWVEDHVPGHGLAEERAEALLAALSARGLTPDAATRTGAEVFATGRYNCLGLAHLIVPLARNVGIDARYVRVRSLAEPVDLGDTVVLSGHVAAAFGSPGAGRWQVVDPVPTTDEELRGVVVLTDAQAAALHHVNRGAEETLAGRPAEALRWFALAEALADDVPELWVDRAAALRRLHRDAEAEQALRRALAVDPTHGPAWRGLAHLQADRGRPDAAQQTLEAVAGRARRDPLTALALGDTFAELGAWVEARAQWRRARRLGASPPAARAALGRAALNLGDRARAERLLQRAAAAAPDHPRVRTLRRELAAAASGTS